MHRRFAIFGDVRSLKTRRFNSSAKIYTSICDFSYINFWVPLCLTFQNRMGGDPYTRFPDKSRLRTKAEENPIVAVGLGTSLVTLGIGSFYVRHLRRVRPDLRRKTSMHIIYLRLLCCGIVVTSLFITSIVQPPPKRESHHLNTSSLPTRIDKSKWISQFFDEFIVVLEMHRAWFVFLISFYFMVSFVFRIAMPEVNAGSENKMVEYSDDEADLQLAMIEEKVIKESAYDNYASSTFSTKQYCQKYEHKVDLGLYSKVSLWRILPKYMTALVVCRSWTTADWRTNRTERLVSKWWIPELASSFSDFSAAKWFHQSMGASPQGKKPMCTMAQATLTLSAPSRLPHYLNWFESILRAFKVLNFFDLQKFFSADQTSFKILFMISHLLFKWLTCFIWFSYCYPLLQSFAVKPEVITFIQWDTHSSGTFGVSTTSGTF